MTVSYEAAMATLTSMFADVDKEVVALILQANNGHMENSVENLLALSGGGSGGGGAQQQRPQQQQRQPSLQQQPQLQRPGSQQQQQAPAYRPPGQQQPYPAQAAQGFPSYPGFGNQQQQQQAMHHRRESSEYKSGPLPPQQRPSGAPVAQPVSLPPSQQPQPPQPVSLYTLPDDFLRPPSYFERLVGPAPSQLEQVPQASSSSASEHSSAVQSQIDQDHILAQLLTDELFMQDLRAHPERYQGAGQPVPLQQQRPPQQQQQPSSGSSSPSIRPQPARMAPAAHPHPDFDSRPRAPSSAGAGAGASSPAVQPQQNSGGVYAPAPLYGYSDASGMGSEPLHPNLQHLSASSSNDAPPLSSAQQSSFASRWASLTSAAREKLSRLSEKLKKSQAHSGSEEDGGGDYAAMSGDGQEMGEMQKRQQQQQSSSQQSLHAPEAQQHPSFLSAEEAQLLQAGYAAPGPARSSSSKKHHHTSSASSKHAASKPPAANAFTVDDEVDPFGRGANGSDNDENDDLPSVSRPNRLAGQRIPSVSGLSQPNMARTISEIERAAEEEDEDDDEEVNAGRRRNSYQPPRLSGAFSLGSPSHRQSDAVQAESDDDDDQPSAAAVRKRSSADAMRKSSVDKARPLLEDL